MVQRITANISKVIVLVVVITCTFMCKNVFADSRDVTVNSVDTPVYSLDVSWGKMQFVYDAKKNYEWSSTTHEYNLVDTKYSWNATGNNIIITNGSSFGVDVSCVYTNNYGSLKGTFSNNNFTIASKKNAEVEFNLSGVLSKKVSNFSKVGTITLKFA